MLVALCKRASDLSIDLIIMAPYIDCC